MNIKSDITLDYLKIQQNINDFSNSLFNIANSLLTLISSYSMTNINPIFDNIRNSTHIDQFQHILRLLNKKNNIIVQSSEEEEDEEENKVYSSSSSSESEEEKEDEEDKVDEVEIMQINPPSPQIHTDVINDEIIINDNTEEESIKELEKEDNVIHFPIVPPDSNHSTIKPLIEKFFNTFKIPNQIKIHQLKAELDNRKLKYPSNSTRKLLMEKLYYHEKYISGGSEESFNNLIKKIIKIK